DALEFRVLRDRLFAMDTGDSESGTAESFEITVLDAISTSVPQWLQQHREGPIGVDVTGSYAGGQGDAWSLALAGADETVLTLDLTDLDAATETAVGQWLADTQVTKVVHDAKRAWHCLGSKGFELHGVAFDTAIAAYLCHPDQRSYTLEDLAVRFIGKELRPQGAGGGQQELALDGPGELEETAVRAAAVRELAGALTTQLEERHAGGLLSEVELPVSVVLTRMEEAGIAADTDYLHELEKHFDAGVRSAAEQAYEQIGREVNLSSPKQLQEVLFGDLDMPKTRKTK